MLTSDHGGPSIGPVDWQAEAGDWSILVGPPGSGKSAVLAVLAGLRAASSGEVVAGAEAGDGADGRTDSCPRWGLVFEGGGRLLHRLSVAENVALPLRYHHNLGWEEATPRVEALLGLVGLTGQARLTPGQLKPWQRQRAALARTLALDPEFLLLDNPTAGLPPQEVAWWQSTLSQLHRGDAAGVSRPLGLLLACEDPRPWWELGTQFVWLSNGTWTPLGDRETAVRRREEIWQQLFSRP